MSKQRDPELERMKVKYDFITTTVLSTGLIVILIVLIVFMYLL